MVTTNNDSEDEEIVEIEESSEEEEVVEEGAVESSDSEEYTAIWKQVEGRQPMELLKFTIRGSIEGKPGIYIVVAPDFTSACDIAKIDGGRSISVGEYSEE